VCSHRSLSSASTSSLAAEALRLLHELAYGEVRLLLSGARFAEGQAPNLHYRLMGARVVRLASHLAWPQLLRRLDVAQHVLSLL